MGSPVVHWEMWTRSPEKINGFYKKVFDWQIKSMPEQKYHLVDTGAGVGINGGIMTPPHAEPWPGNTTLYIDVPDLAEYRKRVVEAGGKILIKEQDVPNMGTFSLVSDPDGRPIGLWKHREM